LIAPLRRRGDRRRLGARVPQRGDLVGMPLEHPQEVADRAAREDFAALVFLKCVRPAADDLAGLALREAQGLADASDVARRQQMLGAGLEDPQGAIGDLHVDPAMDALIRIRAVPAGHGDANRLALVGQRHRAHPAHHGLAGHGREGSLGHVTSP